jgi:hypothetical protein
MTRNHIPPLDARAQRAVDELKQIIWQHYPEATFEIQQGQDDPEAIHLVTTVDMDDTDALLDLVMERMMALQIDEDLPLFVIPIRPPAPVHATREAMHLTHTAGVPLSAPQS